MTGRWLAQRRKDAKKGRLVSLKKISGIIMGYGILCDLCGFARGNFFFGSGLTGLGGEENGTQDYDY